MIYFRYFFSLPFVFGKACAVKIPEKPVVSQVLSSAVAVIFYITIEYSFSYTFPSTPFSSITLCTAHLILLGLLYHQPSSQVYILPQNKVD